MPQICGVMYPDSTMGRIQLEVEGGQQAKSVPTIPQKVSISKAGKNLWTLIQEISIVFLLNNALIYMLPSHSDRNK